MKKDIFNYRVFIEKERQGKKLIFSTYCPSLGLADFGESLDEAVKNMTDLITFHVGSLSALGYEVPTEREAMTLVTYFSS